MSLAGTVMGRFDRAMSRFRRDERGSVGITFALAGSAVIALAIGAVDHGMRANTHSSLQSVVDGAALAGARHLAANARNEAGRVRARIEAETRRLVTANMAQTLGNDATLVAFKTEVDFDRALVTVTMSVDKRGLAPFTFHQVDRTLSARSAASRRIEDKPLCVLALGTDTERGVRFVGDAPISLRDCVVWSNSRSATSIALADRARVTAERLCASGTVGDDTVGRLAPEPEQNCDRREDPFRAWRAPTAGECGQQEAVVSGRPRVELRPGIFCNGLQVDADHVTLHPGLYVVRGGQMTIRAATRLVAEGVTIALSSDVRGVALVGLGETVMSAPTRGPHAGLLIAQQAGAREKRDAFVIGQGALRLSGIVYLPDRNLNVLGRVDARAVPMASYIGHSVTMGGGIGIEGKLDPEIARHPGLVTVGLATPFLRR